ncbi:hypothetical protein K1W69_26395 [Hoeflea sp. WL0058]|uniref:Uncharacterized protein n=1 Tax=Flavimaribacter sediminis TaxID=2865987 RepID=A0AAE3D3C3_9HYPH|nr:hypothetical protein [Flavimaribacter sediminis]MBW8640749.1 hypothetical protein [Flavimaribacter sediminis]
MTVIEFPLRTAVFQPLGHYVRLGESSYRKIADLVAAGVINSRRFVVDASKIKHMKDIIQMLQGLGAEIVLDPKTVELSSRHKCWGMAAGAPWASNQRGDPLSPEVFRKTHSKDIFGQIARHAVEFGVSAVLSPTHYLADPDFDEWYAIDLESCELLRNALDREGGKEISIDYLIAARLLDFNDQSFQAKVMEDLANLPIENLWVRASMASPDSSPINAQRLIRTLAGWHNIGVPIVMDYFGGLSGEALLSMNVVSGIAHSYGEQSSFTTSNWGSPPKLREKDEQGGRATRIGLTSLGRSFTTAELEVLLSAHGAKSALLPNDRKILPNGLDDLRNDPRRFNASEAQRRIQEIAETPTINRPDNFADKRMREVVSTAKKAAKLNPKPDVAEEHRVELPKLRERLIRHRKVSEKLRGTYEVIALERAEQGTTVRVIGAVRPSIANAETGTR